ncbi:leucine--tRNA ligase [Patescibacteria group bacterium]|nr:leucine--tRNA ligase [Patescibacteria group bacterium]
MKAKQYDHLKIEKKWRKQWDKDQTYKAEATSKKKKYYVLDMFPYPSGVGLHVGHPRGYIASDVFARMKRMSGFNVLHPMGFDSFGLPAEQYAISTGKHPGPFTDSLVKHYKEQLSGIGFSYDWSREVSTHRPEYYKWTQWIFIQLFESWYDSKKDTARPIKELLELLEKSGNKSIVAVTDSATPTITAKDWKAFTKVEKEQFLMSYRLAYEGIATVNWCAELGTVLANDEIVDGPNGPVSERGGYAVVKKPMRQWFMRITAYADRLAQDLDGLDWSHSIKEIQKNWIGKSVGSEIEFALSGGESIKVFTTRADTLFGVTYVVLAPEHQLLEVLKPQIKNLDEVESYIEEVQKKEDIDRTAEGKEKTGIELKGVTAVNPANGEVVPVWIADYVLAGYGTGAVMGVPQHDERDHAFATKYKLEIIDKPLVDAKVITKTVGGKLVTKYKMRDAIFARQRYWGEPIPLRHNADGTVTPIKEKELPLVLPKVKSFTPAGTGDSPLAAVKAWTNEGYETNTMPGWAGSSWYFLRYMDPLNEKAFASKKALDYWQDVDMYVGGAEHATGHLLYSRFWHKFLFDRGYVPTKEPFKALRNQGMIGGTDGRKMSKRWGNVINPDDVIKIYGADSLRVFEMFLGPFEAHLPWSTDGIIGSRRFIERVWRFAEKVSEKKSSESAERTLHKTIKKVTEDIATFSFNTAVSSMMICLNEFEKAETVSEKDFKVFIQLLAPFAPHMTEELWNELGNASKDGAQHDSAESKIKSIHISGWPTYNPKLLIEDTVTVGIQINGKVRGEITIALDSPVDEVERVALLVPKIKEYLAGKTVKKVIVVPGRIINIVAVD